MATWKKIVSVDSESSSAGNSFVTINANESVEVVRIDDLAPITPDTDSDVAATIANDPDNYLFVVDEVDQNAHKKLALDDLIGAIGASLVLSTDPQAQVYFSGTTSGLAGDLDDDGAVSTSDLLAFLSGFGQTGTAYDSKVNLTTTASVSLSDATITPQTAATIPFSTADATISTVNVAGEVDATTETITFQNSSDGTTSDEWFYTHQNRKIRIASPSTVAFSVVTTLTNTQIYFIAKYTAYNTNNVLQETSWIPIKLQTFGTAGPYDVSLDQAVVTQAQVGTAQTGRVEVQIQAYVLNGEDATVSINDLDIQMLRN